MNEYQERKLLKKVQETEATCSGLVAQLAVCSEIISGMATVLEDLKDRIGELEKEEVFDLDRLT